MRNIFTNKIILITGGTGTIGSELVRQVITHAPKQVRIFSRDETRQYELQQALPEDAPVRFLVGDIRDHARLNIAMRGVDIVLHAAAMKHVPYCEYNPYEAVKTNIIGTQNIIELAVLHKVERVVGISTDKAPNPKNVLGVSKLMMEKLLTNANFTFGQTATEDGFEPTRFACVRFGNIAWSRGSVLPLWQKQAATHGTISITDPKMTRFFISQQEAIALVLDATELMRGGEVFVLKMPAIALGDLARAYIEKYHPNKKVRIIRGKNRGSEKKHEELLLADDPGEVYEGKGMLIFLPHMNIPGLARHQFNYQGFKRRKPYTYSSHKNIKKNAVKKII